MGWNDQLRMQIMGVAFGGVMQVVLDEAQYPKIACIVVSPTEKECMSGGKVTACSAAPNSKAVIGAVSI